MDNPTIFLTTYSNDSKNIVPQYFNNTTAKKAFCDVKTESREMEDQMKNYIIYIYS